VRDAGGASVSDYRGTSDKQLSAGFPSDPEEQFMLLQDVLGEVAAGKTDGHLCPLCDKGQLDCSVDEATDTVRLQCPHCRLLFTGVLAPQFF